MSSLLSFFKPLPKAETFIPPPPPKCSKPTNKRQKIGPGLSRKDKGEARHMSVAAVAEITNEKDHAELHKSNIDAVGNAIIRQDTTETEPIVPEKFPEPAVDKLDYSKDVRDVSQFSGMLIDKVRMREVHTGGTGSDKRHLTCVLICLVSGDLLPHMIIFKGKINLKNLKIPKGVVKVQLEAWMDEHLRESGEEATKTMPAPSNQQMIDWIFEACEDMKKKKDMISSNFKVTGVSIAIFGREDHCINSDNEAPFK
ncbi:hypothetical protein CHS0354_027032 [Potamilus streckersoni]|uniref:Uncharacterized protein n=1 Tax=Potamilus streckersoni TaxID=2493646 RepID=A0AAE0TJ40_9BIVA|nr:hypothetical protein CHS0354_027032 [Potamilus streckersoni]